VNRASAPTPSEYRLAQLSIVHPWDPWAQGIGGFDTALDGILRHVPAKWAVELIGLTAEPETRPPRAWIEGEFAGRPVRFFGAMVDREPDRVRPIPLSLRFVLGCRVAGVAASGRIVQFHRFESAMAVSNLPGQRRVLFLHNHPEEVRSAASDVRWRRMAWLHTRLFHRTLRGADAVFSVDPRTPAAIAKVAPWLAHNVWALPQWADSPSFAPGTPSARRAERAALRQGLQIPPDAPVVLFAGRLESQKDPLMLVRAFAHLTQDHREPYLLFVGKGRLERDVRSEARRTGVEARVRMMGAVGRETLPAVYRAADAVACTSAYEGGPRFLFEALACGTPVVTFEVGQIAVHLRQHPRAGIVVTDRNPASFARGLAESLARPLTPARIREAAESVRRHRPAKALRPVFSLYRRWLSTPAGRPGP
jgi:glycosyltransferase involved in cell wall biosynthesis